MCPKILKTYLPRFWLSYATDFGPLYVKNLFRSKQDNSTLFKEWVMLYTYTCATSRAVILDLTPHLDSYSFIRRFWRFVARLGCPCSVISDGGRNFVLDETQTLVYTLGADWRVNLPLAPRHCEFFWLYSFCWSWGNSKQQVVDIYYKNDVEECLTPNHLLFSRQLKLFNLDPFGIFKISYTPADLNVDFRKINHILNQFWGDWMKEYLINLKVHQEVKLQKSNRPQIQLKDVVTVEEERHSRSMWTVRIVEELLQGKDNQIRGSKLRIPKTNSIKETCE